MVFLKKLVGILFFRISLIRRLCFVGLNFSFGYSGNIKCSGVLSFSDNFSLIPTHTSHQIKILPF